MEKQIYENYRFFPLSELKNFNRIKHLVFGQSVENVGLNW